MEIVRNMRPRIDTRPSGRSVTGHLLRWSGVLQTRRPAHTELLYAPINTVQGQSVTLAAKAFSRVVSFLVHDKWVCQLEKGVPPD